MDELLAISIPLSAHDVKEDGHNNIIGDVGWILDDGVTDQQKGTDVLEAVAGKEESNSSGFNGISKDGVNFLLDVAGLIDNLEVINHSQEFSLGFLVVRVLG